MTCVHPGQELELNLAQTALLCCPFPEPCLPLNLLPSVSSAPLELIVTLVFILTLQLLWGGSVILFCHAWHTLLSNSTEGLFWWMVYLIPVSTCLCIDLSSSFPHLPIIFEIKESDGAVKSRDQLNCASWQLWDNFVPLRGPAIVLRSVCVALLNLSWCSAASVEQKQVSGFLQLGFLWQE